MSDPAVTLQRAMVLVFPAYVARKLADRPGVDATAAVGEATAWLASTLEDLLSQPFAEQDRGPLEVFQAAAIRVGQAVGAEAGTETDVPDDPFGLAPASTRDLGRTVWEAHLRWGAAKAAALGSLPD